MSVFLILFLLREASAKNTLKYMLLFLIATEPLTRKILSSTKLQGISLGKATLKVS